MISKKKLYKKSRKMVIQHLFYFFHQNMDRNQFLPLSLTLDQLEKHIVVGQQHTHKLFHDHFKAMQRLDILEDPIFDSL